MTPLDVLTNGPHWQDLNQPLTGHLAAIARRPGGLITGGAGVTLRIELDDGRTVLAETSLAMLGPAVVALMAAEADPDPAAAHRIYFDEADQAGFLAWLKSRPAGSWRVLVGSDALPADDITTRVAIWTTRDGPALVRWFIDRIKRGDIIVRASNKLDLPSGQALS